ncbi:MAG: hypothetical protein ABI565_12345, partial [Vicinamibacteria bacterium]
EAPPLPRSLRTDGRITAALEAIILRALAKDPADRYPSARAFAEAIASADRQPLVVSPPRDVDIELLGAGDTDLHLPPPSLATAKTIPTMEIPPEARAQLDRAEREAAARAPLPTEPEPPRPDAPVAPRTPSATVPGTLLSPVYNPPSRSRWLWALVAIVAAAVGVVIGAIAGAR